LVKFSKIQERDLAARIKWLGSQLLKNGIFTTEFDPQTSMPTSYLVDGPNSYGYKLFSAYRALGGNPERDFILRTSDKPVFLTRGKNISSDNTDTTAGYSDTFTNGRRVRGEQRFDRDLGLAVDKLKVWQLESIKRKREHLEFKIKRCIDYSDQLQSEINLLTNLNDPESGKTVDDLTLNIDLIQNITGAMNVVQDLEDIFGYDIGRPKDVTLVSDYDGEDAEKLR
jgi:hypothetical protein